MQKPTHPDIEKYGYFLQYSPSRKHWYAAYDTDKGATWYLWSGSEFEMITYRDVPNDLKPG